MEPGQELEAVCELGARPRVWSRVGMNVRGRTRSRKWGTSGSMYSGLGLGLWLAGPETFRCHYWAPFRGSSGRPGPQPCAHCSSHSVFATLVHNTVICLLSPCLLSHFPAFLTPFTLYPCTMSLSPSPSLLPISPSPAATSGSAWGSVPLPHLCNAQDGTGAGHVRGGCLMGSRASSFPHLSGVLTSASLETVLRTPQLPQISSLCRGEAGPSHTPSIWHHIPACVWFLQRPVGPCSSLNCLGLSGSSCQA